MRIREEVYQSIYSTLSVFMGSRFTTDLVRQLLAQLQTQHRAHEVQIRFECPVTFQEQLIRQHRCINAHPIWLPYLPPKSNAATHWHWNPDVTHTERDELLGSYHNADGPSSELPGSPQNSQPFGKPFIKAIDRSQ